LFDDDDGLLGLSLIATIVDAAAAVLLIPNIAAIIILAPPRIEPVRWILSLVTLLLLPLPVVAAATDDDDTVGVDALEVAFDMVVGGGGEEVGPFDIANDDGGTYVVDNGSDSSHPRSSILVIPFELIYVLLYTGKLTGAALLYGDGVADDIDTRGTAPLLLDELEGDNIDDGVPALLPLRRKILLNNDDTDDVRPILPNGGATFNVDDDDDVIVPLLPFPLVVGPVVVPEVVDGEDAVAADVFAALTGRDNGGGGTGVTDARGVGGEPINIDGDILGKLILILEKPINGDDDNTAIPRVRVTAIGSSIILILISND
jgi:hypothetical protein